MIRDREYIIDLHIPVFAIDDIEVRKISKHIVEKNNLPDSVRVKIREVFRNKKPRNLKAPVA